MAIPDFDFDPVDSITVGVEGEPGGRTFYLEARSGSRLCTVLVEKVQLRELAAQLLQLLPALGHPAGAAPEPSTGPGAPPGWYVGSIQLALDEQDGTCTMVLQERGSLELSDEDDDEDGEPDPEENPDLRFARVVATQSQLRQLSERALLLVEAGRPICPLCHLPIDPGGHVCPASNGHRRT